MSTHDYTKVILIGNVGSDPRVSGEGKKPFASFSVATNKQYKQDNRKVEETDWHRVVAYGVLAELVKKYVNKGDRLFIEGELRNCRWKDKDGDEKKGEQIVARELRFLGSKKPETKPAESKAASEEPCSEEASPDDDIGFDDDMPF